MSTPDKADEPAYRVDVDFHQIRDGVRVEELTVQAHGSRTFVTRMTEAAASAFEEETSR